MKNIVAANWKMNLLTKEAKELLKGLRANIQNVPKNLSVIICPQAPFLGLAKEILGSTNIEYGAQNCFYQLTGAFTGELSPELIKDLEANYCIVGHSERRQIFNESDEFIAQKVETLLQLEMNPIVCVGETLEERNQGSHINKVRSQVSAIYKSLSSTSIERILFAYEPIWAIGTGETASPDQAEEMHKIIRSEISEIANQEIAEKTPILYGGSVKSSNSEELVRQSNINGFLVGGASLKQEEFLKIIDSCKE